MEDSFTGLDVTIVKDTICSRQECKVSLSLKDTGAKDTPQSDGAGGPSSPLGVMGPFPEGELQLKPGGSPRTLKTT